MNRKTGVLAIAIFLFLRPIVFLAADESAGVGLMDPRLYREVLFPGYEDWNAVWDLHASGQYVYIALCSEGLAAKSARLFRYDIRTGEKRMILDPDRAAGVRIESGTMPQSKFHTAIRTLRDGRLFMVTHNTAAGRFHPDWQLENMRHDPTGFSSRAFIYDPARDHVTYQGVPIPNEDIYYGELDAEMNVYYACGYSTKTLYRIDLKTMTAVECGDHPCWIAIVVDDDHMVYTSDTRQRIWRWDPFRKKSEMTGMRMPHSPFQKEAAGSWVFGWKDPDGWIYAFPQYCNRICRFKPRENRMEDLGNGWRENRDHPESELIFSPVRAGNGRIYYGVLGGMPPFYEDGTEIIEFDPGTGKKRNLGTMKLTDGSLACVIGEGALGKDGRIYWGDGNHGSRGGMMWIFDPRKIPNDYRPQGSVKRNHRYPSGIDNDTYHYPKREKDKPGLWRFTPLPGEFRKSEFSSDSSLRGGKVERVPLEECGFIAGNNSVCGLTLSFDGSIYGIAGDESPALFRLRGIDMKAEAVAMIPGRGKILNGSVIVADRSSVYLAGEHVYRWSSGKNLGLLREMKESERPVALALDAVSSRLYVLTEPANRLMVIDPSSGRLVEEHPLPGYVASRWLVPAKEGGVFGFENNGTIYWIGPDGKPQRLQNRVPSTRGLEFICEVTSATAGPNGWVWGGTREGYLFSIRPDGKRVINHGKPGTYYLKGVVATVDAVYCFGGGDFGDTHLYRFRERWGFEDLGLISRRLVAAAVWKNGALYGGEYSSASAIFRFAPDR